MGTTGLHRIRRPVGYKAGGAGEYASLVHPGTATGSVRPQSPGMGESGRVLRQTCVGRGSPRMRNTSI